MSSRPVLVALAAAVALLPRGARAETCNATSVTYRVDGSLQLPNAPPGLGREAHVVGPGTMVLLFEGGNAVEMLGFSMVESFTARRQTFLGSTVVTTDAVSSATPNACGVVAVGHLVDHTIHWETPMLGFQVQGTKSCWGLGCGDFTLPPVGVTPMHIGPAPLRLADFVFSRDMKTFRMAAVERFGSGVLSLSGRVRWRACAARPSCSR